MAKATAKITAKVMAKATVKAIARGMAKATARGIARGTAKGTAILKLSPLRTTMHLMAFPILIKVQKMVERISLLTL